MNKLNEFYPEREEIDSWADEIYQKAFSVNFRAELCEDEFITERKYAGAFHMVKNRIVKFTADGLPAFYGLWQPVPFGPAPLAVHTPGYGAELGTHPDTVAQGFNLLTVSPLGYWTPKGLNQALKRDGDWPVLPDTVLSGGERGYRDWLLCAAIGVRWAWEQAEVIPGRVSFYGTSQGGGGSLLLGSVFSHRGCRCVAADEPFLTDFTGADFRGYYSVMKKAFDSCDRASAWRALGLIDTTSHVHRMDYPVMLTAGGSDEVCPADTIKKLHGMLRETRMLYEVKGRGHGYDYEVMPAIWAWLKVYG